MDSAIESELTADMSNQPSLISDMSMEPTSSDAGEMTTPTRRFKKSNRALIRASSSTPRIMSPEQKAKRDKAKFAFEAFMNELHEKSHGDAVTLSEIETKKNIKKYSIYANDSFLGPKYNVEVPFFHY